MPDQVRHDEVSDYMRLFTILVAGLIAAPAIAQTRADPYTRALAAGYKAAFLCSDIFNAGQTEELVERDELQRTYPELEPIMKGLTATVDRQARRVSVGFDDKLPPRIAVWRPALGCAQLPIGASDASVPSLPAGIRAPDLDSRQWPMGDRKATARPRGDARALTNLVSRAFDRRSFGQGSETTAVLVVQDGRIVAERYRPDFTMHTSQRTWSVAKSMAATVIGAAVQQNILDVNAPAPVPEWRAPGDPRGSISTDQLLRMASGLHSDTAGNRTDAIYFGGTTVTEQATSWPLEVVPGTRFRYANNDTMLAVRGLRAAIGDDGRYLAFPFTDLFWKTGMTRTFAETDWQGNFILSSQVWTTARDLGRLGLLYLADGVWQGQRILPPGWLDYVRRQGPAQPASGGGYGAGFWAFPKEAGLPADAAVMRGNRGQFVAIVPSQRLVIVRRGFDGASTQFDFDAFTKGVLAALR
jgi:CubicO group peptidase (beta-lactamase class C family)